MNQLPAGHGHPCPTGEHIASSTSTRSALARPSAGLPHSQHLSGSQEGENSQAWLGSHRSRHSPAQLGQSPARHSMKATPVKPKVQFLHSKPTPTEAATVTCKKCRIPVVLRCCMKSNGNSGRWFYSWCESQLHRKCQNPCHGCSGTTGPIARWMHVCMLVHMGWLRFLCLQQQDNSASSSSVRTYAQCAHQIKRNACVKCLGAHFIPASARSVQLRSPPL